MFGIGGFRHMDKAKKRIIIVEDKSIVSHDLRKRLEVLGYEVPGIAASGEKAIELVKEHMPDLVLMDIQLEGEMDGIEAANQIKAEYHIPVIFLTAFSDEATLKRAMITEPYAYIIKPFEPRELQVSIEIALYKHEMETELEDTAEFLDMILGNTEEGIFVLNDDFEYVYINAASGRMMGHDPKEWIGKRAGSNVHPEDAGIGLAALQVMYEKGKADFTARIKRYDEVYRHLHITYSLMNWRGSEHVLGVSNDITDILEATNMIRESEEQYRTLFESSADAVMLLDDTGFIDCNEATLYMFGLDKKDEFIGVRPSQLSPPYQPDDQDSQKAANEKIAAAYQWGHNRFEWVHRRKSGEDFPAEVWLTAFELKGKLVLQATVRDLTEKKRIENELERHRGHLEEMVEETYKDLTESEEKYRHLIERANDGIVIIQDGLVKYLNDKILQITGLEKHEILDNEFTNLIPPEIRGQILDFYKRRMAGEDLPSIYEITLLRNNGDVVPVEINAGIINFEGKPADLAFIRDLTQRKKTEKALVESEEKFRDLAEQSPNMIFINQGGKVIYVNPECERVMGYTKDEFYDPDFDFMGLISAEYKEIVGDKLKNHMQGVEVQIYECVILDKEGNEFDVINSTKLISYLGQPAILGVITDISERKKAEEEIMKKTLEWETTFNSMSDWVSLIDSESSLIIQSNQASEYILGLPREEIIGKVCNEIVHKGAPPDDCPLAKSKLSGKRETMEFEEGGRWFHVSVEPVINDSGPTTNFVHIVRDISEKKKAEDSLIESEERFRQVAESAGEWIWEVDANGLYTYASPAIERILGYKPEEVVGKKHFYDFFTLDARDEMKQAAISAFERKEHIIKFENTNLHKEGHVVFLETSGTPILDKNNDLVGYRGLDTDITERKKAEEAPLITQFAIERMSDATFWMDSDANFFYVNNAACESLGYTRSELLGMSVADIDLHFPKDRWADHWKGHWDGLKNVRSSLYESVYKTKDGAEFSVEVTNNYIRYKDKEYNCAIARDITDRKKSEKAIQESHEKIRGIFSSMDDLVFGVDSEGVFIFYHSPENTKLIAKPEDFLGRKYSDVLPPMISEQIDIGFEKTKNGDIYEFEYPLKTEKIDLWFSAKLSPYMLNNKPSGFISVVRDITQRKRSERALRDGERFLANIFESIQDGLIVMDTDLKIVSTNKTIEKWFPHKMPFEGKTCNDLLQCDSPDGECKCPSRDVLALDESELRVIRKIGQDNAHIGWLELHSFPMHDVDTGELTGVIEYVRDITEKRKAEEERFAFQNQLDAFFHASTDGIGIEKDERFIYANPRLVELFGCTDLSELIGKKPSDFMSPESAIMVSEYHVQRTAGKFAPTYYEFKAVRKNDGSTFDAEVSIHEYKIKDEFYTVGFVRDITERKQAENQRRTSEAQYRSTVNSISDSIHVVDRNMIITIFNESFQEWCSELSLNCTDAVGKHVTDIFPFLSESVMAEYKKVFEDGQIIETSEDIDIDGKVYTTQTRKIPLMEGGQVVSIVTIVRDMTEEKRRQEEDVKQRILEAQFEMKSVLTDLVPIFLDSMGSTDRVQFIENLSDKLEGVLDKRYYDGIGEDTAKDIGRAYIRVLEDLGGESYLDCVSEDSCLTKVIGCPWNNQETRNLILCILCRGIASKFAQRSKSEIDIKLRKTMADGSSECEITVEKK